MNDVRAREVDYVPLDSDGEEMEYAEYSEEQLLLERAKLKRELAEHDANTNPDQGATETD